MPAHSAPLAADDIDRVRRLRDAFDTAGLTGRHLRERLGVADKPNTSYGRGEIPRLLRRCPPREPFGALARMFLLGVPVTEADARAALGPAVDDAAALGVLGEAGGGGFVGKMRVTWLDDLLLWAEAPWNPDPPPRTDHVMSVSPTSRELVRFAVPPAGGRVLDLATGCGVVAIHLAPHAARVVATDFNPRAANVAAFNAAFQRLGNVDVRGGSWFEPVGDESFDRIVCNPPFVITPPPEEGGGPRILFQSAEYRADGVSEMVVRETARHLRAGGFGQVLVNWAYVRGQDWRRRVAGWVRDTGCDAWLLRFTTKDADRYATEWMPDEADADAAARRFGRWMAYFEREGIEAVGYGVITLRKRESGRGWFAEDEAPMPNGACGESVVRGFAARDFLTSRSDDDILRTTFRLAPDARVTQTLRPTPTGMEVAAAEVRLTAGLGFSLPLDALGAGVVGGGRDRPLAAALAALAAAGNHDPDRLTAAALPVVKALVERGIFLPDPA